MSFNNVQQNLGQIFKASKIFSSLLVVAVAVHSKAMILVDSFFVSSQLVHLILLFPLMTHVH